MNKKIMKQSLALVLCVIFLSTSVSTAVVSEENEEVKNIPKKVTLLRYGPDGTVKPVEVDVTIDDGENLEEALADKCEELCEKDVEIQNFINKFAINNTNRTFGLGVLKKVKSSGRGFHFKSILRIEIKIKRKLLSNLLPKIKIRPFVYCNYKNDPNAYTKISPILSNSPNSSKIISGSHKVLAIGFIGYTTWLGRTSFSPIDIFPRSFSGISLFVVGYKPLNLLNKIIPSLL